MKSKIKEIFASKKGVADYIELCISLIVLLAVLVFSINVYEFYTIKDDLNEIGETLVEYAAVTGKMGSDFEDEVTRLQEMYPQLNFSIDTSGTEFWNTSAKTIDRGARVVVKVTTKNMLKGLGIVENLQIPCSVVKTATCTGNKLSLVDR